MTAKFARIPGYSKEPKDSYVRNCEIFPVCRIRKPERTIFHLASPAGQIKEIPTPAPCRAV